LSASDAACNFGAPVLAVCGFSGSGKTTLLEAVIPRLTGRGLAVAVVKHDAHGFEVDRPGKDSDRFFRAGATVTLSGPGEQFERRGREATLSLKTTLARFSCDHDLLLVEGHKDTQLPKLWLANAEQAEAPEGVSNILRTLPWNGDRVAAFMEFMEEWLRVTWRKRPLYGGLLVGGASSRMGSPKQMIAFGGSSLGEIAVAALGAALGDGRSVVLGAGMLAEVLKGLARLADPPGFGGPAAALISAHRWAPEATWIVAACDHPWLRGEHIAWLAAQREPGRWAVIPRQSDGFPCPTLALYEPQALEALERQACQDGGHNGRPQMLMESPRTLVLSVPPELADGWKSVNTPEELRAEEERLAPGCGDVDE
jgi:molybdopterin-guanine dinucleotide biosynthesis protein MobB